MYGLEAEIETLRSENDSLRRVLNQQMTERAALVLALRDIIMITYDNSAKVAGKMVEQIINNATPLNTCTECGRATGDPPNDPPTCPLCDGWE